MRSSVSISVVLCNYNYAKYVEEAIQSVLNQTVKEFELVVVDDGSTDDSVSRIRGYEDDRMSIVVQPNQGQAAALNSGFDRCTGKYIAFLDSDDFWYENKLEATLGVLEKGDLAIVQHNLDVVDSSSMKTGGIHPGLPQGRHSLQSSYFHKNHVGFFSSTSGMVCNKNYLERIFPIDPSWTICADVAFAVPLLMMGEIVTLEAVLGAYRIHGNNQWMNSKQQSEWLKNQQSYVDYANSWLEKLGYEERLDFTQSDRYAHYKKAESLSGRLRSWAQAMIRPSG